MKRQANILSSVIKNFDTVEQVIATSANSTGSAMAENAKWLDSIEGKTYQFTNALETMWSNMIDSETVKTFIDFGTKLIQFLDTTPGKITAVVAALGLLKKFKGIDVFGAVGSLFGISNAPTNNIAMLEKALANASRAYMNNPTPTNLGAMKKAQENLNTYKSKLNDINVAQGQVGDSAEQMGDKGAKGTGKLGSGAAAAGKQIASMLKTMMIMYAITTALDLIGKGISALTEKARENSQSAEVLHEKYTEATEELSACNSELSNLEAELDSTNKKIEELTSQGALTFVEQEELNRLREVSAELEKQISMTKTLQSSLQTGANSAAYNAAGAYLGTSFSSKESKTERQEKAEEDGKEAGSAWGLGFGAAVGVAIALGAAGFFTGGTSWAGIPAALAAGAGTIGTSAGIGSLAGGMIGGSIGSASAGAAYDQEQTVKEAIESMNATRDQLIKARDEAYAAYASDPGNDELKEAYQNTESDLAVYDESMSSHISQMQQYYNSMVSSWKELAPAQQELVSQIGDYLDAYNIVMGGIGAEKNAIDRAFGDQATEEVQAAKVALQEMAANGEDLDWTKAFDGNEAAANDFIDRMYKLGVYVYQMEDYFYDLADAEAAAASISFSDIAKDIIGITDAISGLKSALEEFGDQGYISPQTLIDLKEAIINDSSSEELKAAFEEYSEAMLSGTATVQEASEITERLAQQYIEDKIALGELTEEQKLTYVHLLKHELGIKNAEEFIDDRLQVAGLKKLQEEFDKFEIDGEAPDWASEEAVNSFIASEAIQDIINKYGLEADAIDLIIQKLKEKKELEATRDTEKEKLDVYNKFINGSDGEKGFGKLQQDYQQAVKALESYTEEIKGFDPTKWYVYVDPETSNTTWKSTVTGEVISVSEYNALRDANEAYLRLKSEFEALEEAYNNALAKGIAEGFLTEDGEISRGIKEGFENAYNEAENAVDNAEKEIETEFTIAYDLEFVNKSGPNTLTGLTNEIAQYKSAVESIAEIGFNGQRLTEEQFAAIQTQLKDITDGAYDLYDAIDTTDGYVIKDIGLLKDLVDVSKQVTAQNIRLARSQAKLKYYEKYKELQQLTKGQKVTNAATLAHVKTIYKEMAAIQKSISRYNMLEHELLGATNAYEEFAKAQDIDAANDYASKAEELVGYLVDAFQTGKLGTESAQAAIMGLVPESVYEDLDTLDEKMAAVYKYFTEDLSKYFYVKFNEDGTIESAEMLVDNVKQFVEDGISKGVFTGSWEEWDLDSTINSLDELAERMGVTKEVAYAFLQAMETYDISWIGGDASTLLDRLVPTTSQVQAAKERMQEIFNQTPIDLSARVKVSAETMREAGYTDFEGTYATVYSTGLNSGDFGLYNEDGSTFEILATPILPNGEVLSEDELNDYIQKQLDSGKKLEEIDVFIGAYATVEEAEEAAQLLHEMQEQYFDMLEGYNLENAITINVQKRAELEYKIATGQVTEDSVVSADGTTAGEQRKLLEEEAEANALAARANVAEWTRANEAYERAKNNVTELTAKLKEAQEAEVPDANAIAQIKEEIARAERAMWEAAGALADIAEPKEVVLTVAKEEIEKDIAEIEAKLKETFDGIEIESKVYHLEDFIVFDSETSEYKVNYELVPDGYSTDELERYVGLLNEKYSIDVLQGEGVTTTLDVLTEIKGILEKTYEIMVNTDDAEEETQSFADMWDGITDKKVTLWSEIKQGITSFFTKKTPDEGDAADVNGTAHVGGTAFAGGSWGASQTETALVGEVGPELV